MRETNIKTVHATCVYVHRFNVIAIDQLLIALISRILAPAQLPTHSHRQSNAFYLLRLLSYISIGVFVLTRRKSTLYYYVYDTFYHPLFTSFISHEWLIIYGIIL